MIFNFHSFFKDKILNAYNVTLTSLTRMVYALVKRHSLLITINVFSAKKVSLDVSHADKIEHVDNVIKVCSYHLIRLNALQSNALKKALKVIV